MLHSKGVTVWIISGGFVRMIQPVATGLGVDREHIIANVLLFDEEGNYRDFDHESPTARTGGKLRAVEGIRANLPKDAVVALIGDGVTDLEARPACNLFIGTVCSSYTHSYSLTTRALSPSLPLLLFLS